MSIMVFKKVPCYQQPTKSPVLVSSSPILSPLLPSDNLILDKTCLLNAQKPISSTNDSVIYHNLLNVTISERSLQTGKQKHP